MCIYFLGDEFLNEAICLETWEKHESNYSTFNYVYWFKKLKSPVGKTGFFNFDMQTSLRTKTEFKPIVDEEMDGVGQDIRAQDTLYG